MLTKIIKECYYFGRPVKKYAFNTAGKYQKCIFFQGLLKILRKWFYLNTGITYCTFFKVNVWVASDFNCRDI